MNKGDKIFTFKHGQVLTYKIIEELVPGSVFGAVRETEQGKFFTVVENGGNGQYVVIGRDLKSKCEMSAGDIFADRREILPKAAMRTIEGYRRRIRRLQRACGILLAAFLGICAAFVIA